jgi:hypothetical protein
MALGKAGKSADAGILSQRYAARMFSINGRSLGYGEPIRLKAVYGHAREASHMY